MPPPHNLRDETLKLNELASNIQTVADARRFIDTIAELLADDLPPAWTTKPLLARLAQAEHLTVTDPHKRISEQNLAAAWNSYLTTIGASGDSHVSAAEIHVLRETHFTRGRAMWDRGYLNFWLLPSIFATNPDGTLAPSCRLVESFRMLYDLNRFPETLRGIRESVSKPESSSDLTKQPSQNPSSTPQVRAGYLLLQPSSPQPSSTTSPAEAAARRERSMKALTSMIEALVNNVLNA